MEQEGNLMHRLLVEQHFAKEISKFFCSTNKESGDDLL
jgi:hypothetical protein